MNRTSISSEAVLVKQYIDGDEKSLSTLINRHQQKIFSFIFSKVYDKDLAEDIFQDTFIKVIRTLKRGKYNEEGKFLPWVMRIAHNLVIDHFRKSNRMPKFEGKGDFEILDFMTDDDLNAERQIIKSQIETDLHELIKELPQDQLEVLEMRIFKEMSFKEIAFKTDVSINTALGRMRYALINLRKIIEKHQVVLTN
ncbi:sigma-70 family RNA polymerase sigma factor [Psychroflexus gondwanensis]|jgi:RNA polymerase sigma-70 factor (ECF subfamily)|uniref:RNA polymerase sigma factor, sigma 70 superfamily protein n=1 Tax=Psychroflexus gondwanensis ACAM 44 TaxID=1189619 RepID=N1WYG2_9FLAO|nr:sigma-70 family RNA polymerase sigma factor [Psychroflexus gondwanensis]EMY82237.1 RNA polymerase sigma factor, sigma 70 superfamily protein [Psychroflexus gondwanensis ACAM 44]TXE17972.1 sigma-70 family RNA polymerase sigma factor [Psychroflexus gondwanensis]